MARSLKRQNEHGGTADSSDDLTYYSNSTHSLRDT